MVSNKCVTGGFVLRLIDVCKALCDPQDPFSAINNLRTVNRIELQLMSVVLSNKDGYLH